jgi:hypothetical protein
VVERPDALESELLGDFRDLRELAEGDASVTVRQGDMDVNSDFALSLKHGIAERPSNGAHDRIENGRRKARAQRTTIKKVTIDGRDFLAEQYAGPPETSSS